MRICRDFPRTHHLINAGSSNYVRTYIIMTLVCSSVCVQVCTMLHAQDNKTVLNFAEHASVADGTGTFVYTIPIFTLKSEGVEFPISLKYTGEGLKVREEAPAVGVGWQLMAGGEIRRHQNGLPDDLNITYAAPTIYGEPNYPFGTTTLPWRVGYLNSVNIARLDAYENAAIFEHPENEFELEASNKKSQYIVTGRLDFQPDYFESTALNAHRGGFYLKRGASKLPQHSNERSWSGLYQDMHRNIAELTTAHSQNRIGSFRLKSALDGNTYEFDRAVPAVFKDKDHEGYDLEIRANTSWQLTKVISPNNENLFEIEYFQIFEYPNAGSEHYDSRLENKNFLCYQEADATSGLRSNCKEQEWTTWVRLE